MTILDKKINQSKQIIKKALSRWGTNIAVAWTGGKDSTVVLHIVRKVKGGIDLPVLHLDMGLDFPETYVFMEKVSRDWNFSVIRVGDPRNLARYRQAKSKEEKSRIAAQMKINALNKALRLYSYSALLIGIRADEHPARSKESYFSKREDHTRVHPILHFTEADVWQYIRREKVPYNPLYDQGFRSLGFKDLTNRAPAKGSERAGRDRHKEVVMERLRALGYF